MRVIKNIKRRREISELLKYGSQEWRNSLVGAFAVYHSCSPGEILLFEEALGREPTWSDVTEENLRSYRDLVLRYVSDERYSFCYNSARQYINVFKYFLKDNLFRFNLEPYKIDAALKLNKRKEPSEHVFLTTEEIMKLEQYNCETGEAEFVRRTFLLECLTGARTSDARNLTLANLTPDKRHITYVSIKTHERCTVPFAERNICLLTKRRDEPDTVNRVRYNELIRDMCFEIGAYDDVTIFAGGAMQTGFKSDFISSHTARRSFATNLFLKGADVSDIKELMGHSSIEMTQRYIIAKRESKSVEKYFDL